MEKKYGKDKFLLVLGGFLITITLAVPIGYQLWIGIYEGNPYKETEEMKRSARYGSKMHFGTLSIKNDFSLSTRYTLIQKQLFRTDIH